MQQQGNVNTFLESPSNFHFTHVIRNFGQQLPRLLHKSGCMYMYVHIYLWIQLIIVSCKDCQTIVLHVPAIDADPDFIQEGVGVRRKSNVKNLQRHVCARWKRVNLKKRHVRVYTKK